MRIEISTTTKILIQVKGYLWWKRIVVGSAWERLTEKTKQAILAHEFGHIHSWHSEIRLLLAPLMLVPGGWNLLKQVCCTQEFAADAYAARLGLGQEMIVALTMNLKADCGVLHPSNKERIERLKVILSGASVQRK